MPAVSTHSGDIPLAILTDEQTRTDDLLATEGAPAPGLQVYYTLSTGAGKTEALSSWQESLSHHLLVWISAASLPAAAPVVSDAASRHRLAGLLVQDEDPAWLPQLLRRANLRTLRNTFAHGPSDPDVPRRVLSAWRLGAQNDLIADARVVDSKLLVLSCAFEPFEVPFEAHPALARIPDEERSRFAVAEDGSLITWDAEPHAIDLDLDALRYVIDAAFRETVDRERRLHAAAYGAAIRALRKERGVLQSDVDGLSERQVRRIEKEGTTSVDALQSLADAHGLPLNEYLDELAERTP